MTKGRKKKILIIDDEKSFITLVKLNLEESGEFEVETESDSRQAIAKAKNFKPDLILLDVLMPYIDGGQLGHRFAEDEDLKDIPVVFLTAAVTENEVSSRGGVIGEHTFIAKPVTTEKLIESINRHIEKQIR